MTELPPEAVTLDYGRPIEPPRQGMAVAALVLGILAVVFSIPCFPLGLVLGLTGLVLGIIAVVNVSREPRRYGGKGMAIGGIVTSAVGLLIGPPMLVAIMLPSLTRARELAKRAVDAANLVGIGQSVLIYAHDNEDAFPPDIQTMLASGEVTPQQLINPCSGNVPPACDYYYVAYLRGPDDHDAAADPKWILAYSDPNFHAGEGANILYFDGHVEFVKEPKFSAEVERFLKEYEDKHGQPPTIIAPTVGGPGPP